MSHENVDLIRRIYDAWDREESAYAVEPGIRHGRASFRAVRDTYEDFMLKVERFVDAGGA
jgi:hypothetical protein